MNVLERCVKLRSLARSENENEAASARAELFHLMWSSGVAYEDVAAVETTTLYLDDETSFTARALALAVAVSRGCKIVPTMIGQSVFGPRRAAESTCEVYAALRECSAKYAKVPAYLAKIAEREGITGMVEKVCRAYFEAGLFGSVSSRLPAAPASSSSSSSEALEPVFTGNGEDSMTDLDIRAEDLIAEMVPGGFPAHRIVEQLKDEMIRRGFMAGTTVELPTWKPAKTPAMVKGFLLAPRARSRKSTRRP